MDGSGVMAWLFKGKVVANVECSTCRYWKRTEHLFGECIKGIYAWPPKEPFAMPHGFIVEGQMHTDPTFGCIEWQGRP